MALSDQDFASRSDPIIYFWPDGHILQYYGPRAGFEQISSYPTTQIIINRALKVPGNLLRPDPDKQQYWFPSDPPMILLGDGCTTALGEMNCTSMCGNPSSLFMTWQTLWNCLTLASLFMNMPDPNLAPNASLQINKALSYLDMSITTKFDAIGVLNHTYECAVANCGIENSVKCGIMRRNGTAYKDWVDPISNVCTNVYSRIDPDIAGAGVMISYMTQSVLSLYGWGWMCLFTLAHSIQWVVLSLRKSRSSRSFTARLRRLPRIGPFITRIRELRPFVTCRYILRLLGSFAARLSDYVLPIEQVTSTFLVDFQEAQCFFVLSIQIALLFAKSQGADFIGVSNWQSLVDTRTAVDLLAGAGALPIVLTQIGLQKLGIDSIYTHILSTAAVVMAFAAGIDPVDVDYETAWRMFSNYDPLPECGFNTSLTTFCADFDNGLDTLNSSLVAVFAILALLWARKAWHELLRIRWLRKNPGCFYRKDAPGHSPMKDTTWGKVLSFLGPWLLLGAEIFLVTYIAMVFRSLASFVLGTGYTDPTADNWSVGQIISMLIWAPVVVKYLYIAIAGVEKGFRLRLSNAFVVVKKSNLPQTQPDDTTNELDDFGESRDHLHELKNETRVTYRLIRRRSGTI